MLEKSMWALLISAGLSLCGSSVFADEHEYEAEDAVHAEEANHAEHGGHHGDGHHELNWVDMSNEETPPLAFMFVNFALLVVLVILILRKPIGNMVRNRRDSLQTALAEAEKLKEEAEKALAAAKDRMEAMDLEMAKLRKDILEAGKAEAQRIAKDGEARAARMEEDTAALVKQEAARMSAAIREEVVSSIVESSRKIIEEKMAAEDRERLAKEYVESMKEIASS